MTIATEPIGSIPRPPYLQEAMKSFAEGSLSEEDMDKIFDRAVKETIEQFEKTGSPVISDGEQTKPSFVTYPLAGLENLAPDGIILPFVDGHVRQLPRLTAGPFRYSTYAGSYLERAQKYATKPVKQAVIAPSAISLIYPQDGIEGYPRDQFIKDLVKQSVEDIRSCFKNKAHSVQIDFTEARLAIKLDESKKLLKDFIDLNNQVLSHFSADEKKRIGVHTCPGGDQDSTHSADVPYRELIPLLMQLDLGLFYFQMASEENPQEALRLIADNLKPSQKAFIGVINVINEEVESPEVVAERVLHAAEFIPVSQLGTTDDCGYSPFGDDVVTARTTAFAKISARIEGTKLAEQKL